MIDAPKVAPHFIIIIPSRFYHCPPNCVGEKGCSAIKDTIFSSEP
jgi:hypothetical protein